MRVAAKPGYQIGHIGMRQRPTGNSVSTWAGEFPGAMSRVTIRVVECGVEIRHTTTQNGRNHETRKDYDHRGR